MDSNQGKQQADSTQQKSGFGQKMQNIANNVKATFQDHQANPGPVMPKEFNVPEEGTKEERRAKAEQMNKQT